MNNNFADDFDEYNPDHYYSDIDLVRRKRRRCSSFTLASSAADDDRNGILNNNSADDSGEYNHSHYSDSDSVGGTNICTYEYRTQFVYLNTYLFICIRYFPLTTTKPFLIRTTKQITTTIILPTSMTKTTFVIIQCI